MISEVDRCVHLRPVLGLDVDGVIALTSTPFVSVVERTVTAWGRWSRTLVVPESAGTTIAKLAESFEIVWVSAWGHNAHTSLAPVLGLSGEPFHFLPVQFSKAKAVAEYAGNRRWALVHDGVDTAEPPSPGLVIEVDAGRGIGQLEPDKLLRLLADEYAPRRT